jgi:hypothetical protein
MLITTTRRRVQSAKTTAEAGDSRDPPSEATNKLAWDWDRHHSLLQALEQIAVQAQLAAGTTPARVPRPIYNSLQTIPLINH